MGERELRVMAVMPHQDDLEFTAGGTFALLRKALGDGVALHVLCTSRGASGHHEMSPDEIFVRRQAEAEASAAKVGATYECLRQLDGTHAAMQVLVDRNLLGGLWNAMRAFAPDVVFCPPVVSDPLAGVHVDHVHTAQAVRLTAYQLCAPHAYPTMDRPREARGRIPLIINVDDTYACERRFHVRQEITEVYERKLEMALCHRSQIFEWLPWAGGIEGEYTAEDFAAEFRRRHEGANARYGREDGVCSEYFRVTRWGRAPAEGELERVFPRMMENHYRAADEPGDSDIGGGRLRGKGSAADMTGADE